jgi:hypothetical protein
MAEVFVGAGAGATFVPEMDLHLNDVVFASNVGTLDSADTTLIRLIPDLYVGCRITIGTTSSSTDTIITANTINTITVESVSDGEYDVTVHAFGAPVPGPKDGTTPTLLSDHWLGLVDTFTPPNIEVEMKQLNLAVSGSRNYSHQFKAAETVSGGSLELMLNNGSWLYYALGAATFSVGSGTGTWASNTNDFLVRDSTDNIVRSIAGNEYPFRRDDTASATGRIFAWTGKSNNTLTVADLGQNYDAGVQVDDGTGEGTTIASNYTSGDTSLVLTDASGFATTGTAGRIGDNVLTSGDGLYVTKNTADIDYTFTELNGDTLPSFALEVTYDKSTVGASTVIDSNTNNVNRYCRIFTGCQVNNLTLNFEEGQELKATVDMVTRTAFDAPNGFLPRRGVALGVDELQNYHKTREGGVKDDDYPFLFSDGSIKLFGQNVTRVKSGSLTIANNILPQRFIGNTNRKIVSAHIPGQRTYEISLTMLVTDTELWDELRKQDEYDATTGLLELKFTKGNGEEIEIKLDDYIIQNVNVPFPADKGPVEVEATISARTLTSCTYSNAKWAIMM